MEITLDNFIKQWVSAPGDNFKQRHFESQVMSFAVMVGKYTKDRFKESFDIGGFYGSGQKWAPRDSKWSQRFSHNVLNDSGTLGLSIKEGNPDARMYKEQIFTGRGGLRSKVSRIIDISTNEDRNITNDYGEPGKKRRGKDLKSVRGYAAIHNSDPMTSGLMVNQHTQRAPVRRQFIGHSSKIDEYVATNLYPKIFDKFPMFENTGDFL